MTETPRRGLPLDGVGVLITRPQQQADRLCRLIEGAGGKAIRLPLLAIEPVIADPATSPLGRLHEWDWLVFVSTNAVDYGVEIIEALPRQESWPKIAAIGKATAEALEKRGIAVDLAPNRQFNSESLLALPEFEEITGQRFLIVRGAGGRETLADTLRARGAIVAYAEVYRRSMPPVNLADLIDRWQAGEIGVVTLTSGEALGNLARLLGDTHARWLRDTPLVVIGSRIEQMARELGCLQVRAAEAEDEALLEAVIAIATLPQGFSKNSNNGDTALADEDKDFMAQTEASVDMTEAEASSARDPAVKPKRSKLGAWVGYVILLVILLLAAGGFYLLQELRSKQEGLGGELDKGGKQAQELLHQITGLQTEIASLHTQLANLETQVTTEDSKFEREIGEESASFGQKLDAAKTELGASIAHIQRQMNKTRGDMMVADAEYLLSIANQKLQLVGDVKSVLAAMEAADQRLHDSGDPAVFKVREALAEEINALKTFTPPDVVGISAKLLTVESKVKDLPLFLPHSDVTEAKPATTPKPGQQTAEPGNILDDLKGLVTVRHTDKPIKSILLPEEVEALRQVMLLKLEMTRAALLRNEEALFKSSIDSALAWLHEHFDHDAAITQGVAEEIQSLKEITLSVNYPNIGKSLSLLRNIEKLRLESEKSGAESPRPEAGAQP